MPSLASPAWQEQVATERGAGQWNTFCLWAVIAMESIPWTMRVDPNFVLARKVQEVTHGAHHHCR